MLIKAQEQEPVNREKVVENISDEELEQMLQDPELLRSEVTRIEHEYRTYNEPDRLRYVSDRGDMFDIYPMPDGTIAFEPITLKVVYNPNQIKKFDSWEDLQQAIEKAYGDYTPYRSINAKLLKRIIARAVDEKAYNPYL